MSSLAFGEKHIIKAGQIFFQSKLSFAFVNIKPVVKGHVLVCPKRIIKRFKDLSPTEVSDLFLSTQTISVILEKHYNAQSMTIALQDGREAGQTIEHVHVHILPRMAGDFENNDDIYSKLEEKSPSVMFRSEDDMKTEAESLSRYFISNESK